MLVCDECDKHGLASGYKGKGCSGGSYSQVSLSLLEIYLQRVPVKLKTQANTIDLFKKNCPWKKR